MRYFILFLAIVAFCPLASAQFSPGDLFISSSRTDEVRIYDHTTLAFKSSFTHPDFVQPGNPTYVNGPNGAAFNTRGNLVVAAYEKFVEFSAPGVTFATYPKINIEATETILFDRLGNLYTTTATGGSDMLNQYSYNNYTFVQTLQLPAGANQLTGLVFDDQDRLFVGSQTGNQIIVLQADPTFTNFTYSHSIPCQSVMKPEGLGIDNNGDLVVASGDIYIYDCNSGALVTTFDAPNDAFPVPVMIGDQGSIYVADFENGYGSIPADIYRFAPDGSSFVSVNDPGLFGPFGIAVYRVYEPALWLDKYFLSEANGGTITYILDATPSKAGRLYLIFGGLTGSVPGTLLPGGLAVLPINWDLFTNIVLNLTFGGSPVVSNFFGNLDANGQATAQFNFPPLPGYLGSTMTFAYCLGVPWEFVSNPVELRITP